MLSNESLPSSAEEARRQLDICNACRYCEGFCAVFPALQRRIDFTSSDITQLANLCHNCKGCYYACQYTPPHSFAVNLPVVLAEARVESYRRYAWPSAFAGLFERNGTVVSLVAAACMTLLLLAVGAMHGLDGTLVVRRGPGAFYAAIPRTMMTGLAGVTFLYALAVLTAGGVRFWRDGSAAARQMRLALQPLIAATADVLTLRNLGGGGHGCNDTGPAFSTHRRRYHHALFYGFLACFASTVTAWAADTFLGRPAPYPVLSVPVLLGTAGGIGVVVGAVGLLRLKLIADQEATARRLLGADAALLVLLSLIGLTGLALLALRETTLMTVLLALHFSLVLSLFVMIPYSKMVHGLYRALALLRDRQERLSTGICAREQP